MDYYGVDSEEYQALRIEMGNRADEILKSMKGFAKWVSDTYHEEAELMAKQAYLFKNGDSNNPDNWLYVPREKRWVLIDP